ncbi:hypothetical protein BJ878DRAFT_559567 [Calycina marina]|uniref:Uncharacterized protein n=1 Tax=Calycina marina TaxID=1763456 RepID=A0A9P7Z6V6_9HELO|nr:hypothetical protein BJ878DRAFT_559567 [Calycina marina]
MAIRFFQVMAESPTFVGTHYILRSWYNSKELGKRRGIFTASGLAGTILFVVDGLSTLPIAIYGFFLFPDTPQITRAPYLNTHERSLVISCFQSPSTPLPRTLFFLRKMLTSWQWCGFVILWVIAGET